MQELSRVIQDHNSIRQGRKENKIRDEDTVCEYCAEPRHNATVLAAAFRQDPFRVFVNRNKPDLLRY